MAVLSACGAHRRIDPDAIVRDRHSDIVASVIEPDGDLARLRMTQSVGKCFAGNARDIVRDGRA